MGLLNRIFGRSPHDTLVIEEKQLEEIWNSYLDTVIQKGILISEFKDKTYVQRIYAQLDNGLLDITRDEELSEDIQAELHLRLHARNMRSVEWLIGALYDANTKYEFLQGMLSHLHLILANQLKLVKAYLDNKKTNEAFKEEFTMQLEAEETIMEKIQELIQTFHELFADLVNRKQVVDTPDVAETAAYNKIFKAVASISFKNISAFKQVQRLGPHADAENMWHRIALAVMSHVHSRLTKLHDRDEQDMYEDEEFYGERMYFWYHRYINRPEFIDEVRAIIKQEGDKVSEPELKAFVRLFRERANDSVMPVHGKYDM